MPETLVRPDLEAILAHIPASVLLVDAENNVIFANQACEDFFGKALRRILGSPIDGLLRLESGRLAAAINSGEGDITAQSLAIHTPTGLQIADISISVMPDTDGIRLFSIFPRHGDRSHIVETDEAGDQQAVAVPAILSHEIKNPLAGIRGAAQLLAKQSGENRKPLTDLIINEVDRIARLLDQMQNLGGQTLGEIKPHNVHVLIEQAIRSVRAANGNLPSLSINYDPSLPDVFINDDALIQILINLFQNAVDALGGREGATIGVSTRFVLSGSLRETGSRSEEGKTTRLPVEVNISDNGDGVPAHISSEIFSPFVTTKREGQGLGLAIVRKLARQMHARVMYERDDRKGLSHFKLYLPVAEPGSI